MKKAARTFVERILWSQVRRLRRKNDFKVIAVAGSTGKTSTKLAVAQTLQAKYKVRYQEGNYNVPVSVPLVFFGSSLPSLFNPIAWLAIFISNEISIFKKYNYDVVVIELGTDMPGELESFVNRLSADIGLLTSIAPEHMEFFGTLDAVAKEELTIVRLSEKLFYNSDLCDKRYMVDSRADADTYAINQKATIQLTNIKHAKSGYSFDVNLDGKPYLSISSDVFSDQQLYSISAAICVGHELGMNNEELESGIKNITPVPGRMQKLDGIKDSVIIDDTYNASPDATIAALDTLYKFPGSYKIAVLGNMNELGAFSEEAHNAVGAYCDPKQLKLILTIGPDANKYLASAAQKAGCTVERFDDPYSAGKYLKKVVKENSTILFKGSQNNVYCEEAIKSVLADSNDLRRLVRQSDYWMKRKKINFGIK